MKKNTYIKLSTLLFILFIAFTIIVKTVDVQPIGPQGTDIGLAHINHTISNLIGIHMFFYNLTKILGIVALAYAGFFALIGLVQLIQRKSIKKVDRHILILGIFYAVVILIYILFEKLKINYRPVIMHGNTPEASYPSSHTMLALCVMGSAVIEFKYYLRKNPKLMKIVNTISIIIMIVTVVGRLISGVHWFTDIIGSILISSALLTMFNGLIQNIKQPKKHR